MTTSKNYTLYLKNSLIRMMHPFKTIRGVIKEGLNRFTHFWLMGKKRCILEIWFRFHYNLISDLTNSFTD